MLSLFSFGKRRRVRTRRSRKGAGKKPSASVLKMCKKYRVKTTKKVGKRRVYKSETKLKQQCMKKKLMMLKKKMRRSRFGATPKHLVRSTRQRSGFGSACSRSSYKNSSGFGMQKNVNPDGSVTFGFGRRLGETPSPIRQALPSPGGNSSNNRPSPYRSPGMMGSPYKPYRSPGMMGSPYRSPGMMGSPYKPYQSPGMMGSPSMNTDMMGSPYKPYQLPGMNTKSPFGRSRSKRMFGNVHMSMMKPYGFGKRRKTSRRKTISKSAAMKAFKTFYRLHCRKSRFGAGNPPLHMSMGGEFCPQGGGVLESTGLYATPCASQEMAAFGRRRRVGRPRSRRFGRFKPNKSQNPLLSRPSPKFGRRGRVGRPRSRRS